MAVYIWLYLAVITQAENVRTLYDDIYKRWDSGKYFLIVSTEFTWHATVRKYKTRDTLTCITKTIYLVACKCCSKQYVDSATIFKESFIIHQSDINTGKIRCGLANLLLNVCKSAIGWFAVREG